jgi:hypothetical protein
MSEETHVNYPNKVRFEKEVKRWLDKKNRNPKRKHPWHDGPTINRKKEDY